MSYHTFTFCLLCGRPLWGSQGTEECPAAVPQGGGGGSVPGLCRECTGRIVWSPAATCRCCGRELLNSVEDGDQHHSEPKRNPSLLNSAGDGERRCFACREQSASLYVPEVYSLLLYRGLSKDLLAIVKFQNYRPALPLWMWLLERAIEGLPPGISRSADFIPVPGSTSGILSRGYDPVHYCVQRICRDSGWSFNPCIARIQGKSQKTADRRTRFNQARLQYTLSAGRKPTTHEVAVLIDDISTTGASLRACSDLLRSAGYLGVYGITIAQD